MRLSGHVVASTDTGHIPRTSCAGSAVGAPSEPAAGPPVVVTPEELRKHGIDRVRIIPQARICHANCPAVASG